MFHLLQVCLYREMFQKLTVLWCRSHLQGNIRFSAYTARQAQMHISDSHLIYFHIWMRLETDLKYRNPCDFLLLTRSWAISDLCHMGEKKNRNWVTWTIQCKCGLRNKCMFLTSNGCLWLKYESFIHNIKKYAQIKRIYESKQSILMWEDNRRLTFSLEEVLLWIMDWYFGQKQQFQVKTPP